MEGEILPCSSQAAFGLGSAGGCAAGMEDALPGREDAQLGIGVG